MIQNPQENSYVSPQEKLNNAIVAANAVEPHDGKIDYRAVIAKSIYVEGINTALSKSQNISQDSIKMLAVIAVDAADILIAQLAKGR